MHSKCRQEARHASSRQLHELLTPKDCHAVSLGGGLGSERTATANPLFARRGASDGKCRPSAVIDIGMRTHSVVSIRGPVNQVNELRIKVGRNYQLNASSKLGASITFGN